jgi:hypothetical protein
MRHKHITLILASAALAGLSACHSAKNATASENTSPSPPLAGTVDHNDPVQSAMSAAPKAIAEKATIVTANADGSMTTLRKGTNGFTCMPDSPATPGPDPMCMDANAMKWATAWMAHKSPPTDTPGIMYMLAGGTDASNTDPYATKPTTENDWVKTGPHMMVVGSASLLKEYPSGPKPDTRAPYVMWAGTPYAHLMIPVS